MYKGKVLSIAGSDPSGGAGIQADIKTITVLGCYAMCCITALTAQNTLGVLDSWNMSAEIVEKQMTSVLSDIKVDSIKIGMLPVDLIDTVAGVLPENVPVIFDPVMVSSSGFPLVQHDDFVSSFVPLTKKVSIVTPNIVEASIISGKSVINSSDTMHDAAVRISEKLHVNAVLVKGNISQEGEYVENVLLTQNGAHHFKNKRIPSVIHGTGCTLSAAIASFMAQKLSIKESVEHALDYVSHAIKDTPKVGQGLDPVFHNYFLAQGSDS
ncbi:MAG: bifunctional hydroxymethylpyrimidine kinase/phosphomethylpyrimidine kinase [Aaplasma endosymbiont of Hyalomma asiaticum]